MKREGNGEWGMGNGADPTATPIAYSPSPIPYPELSAEPGMATQAGAGVGCGGENRGFLPGQPAPDSLAETRVARLRSFRQPRVEELEERV